jgi:hypothetical protein
MKSCLCSAYACEVLFSAWCVLVQSFLFLHQCGLEVGGGGEFQICFEVLDFQECFKHCIR